MGKLVTVTIGSCDSEGCYPVIITVEREHASIDNRILLDRITSRSGKLPPAPELLKSYQDWQKSYRSLDLNFLLGAPAAQTTNVSTASIIADCQNASKRLLDELNTWLKSASFRDVWDSLKEIDRQDEVRFTLQIDDPILQRLPWQSVALFDSYSANDIVFCSPRYEQLKPSKINKSRVKILAIFGNDIGIDTNKDRRSLLQLPNRPDLKILDQPTRQDINDELWEQNWDILFFGGHSYSTEDNRTGRIIINQNDSLSLEELRYGLKKAIANGLKIAIFNSCDGLGLATSLADLQIPQVIVMREPVPDRVAQTFLANFLQLYAKGNSFGRSVRAAREQLQGLEDKFPCATWLPTVYQQGTHYPPTWEQLQGEGKVRQRQIKTALLTSVATTLAIAATRFLGILQPLELPAFDLTMRSRPAEVQDRHLLVIEVTGRDVKKQQQEGRIRDASSISNQSLNELLELVNKYHPQVIGIDTFLDRDIPTQYSVINDNLKSGYLVSVCKTKGITDRDNEIPPPPGSKAFGFADTIADSNGTIRRHLLGMDAQSGKCQTPYALSTRLAYNYLQNQSPPIPLEITQDKFLKLGGRKFDFLKTHTGGYQQLDDRGYQILLNYRSHSSLRNAIHHTSLGEIFELNDDGQLKQMIENKIVLIGTTDGRFRDIARTPYAPEEHDDRCRDRENSQCIPGVFLQAHMTSQLVNAALENRPLLWATPFWIDSAIVWLCSTIGVLLVWKLRRPYLLIMAGGAIVAILWVGSVSLLIISGYWFPLVPSILGLAIAGSCVKIYILRATTSPIF